MEIILEFFDDNNISREISVLTIGEINHNTVRNAPSPLHDERAPEARRRTSKAHVEGEIDVPLGPLTPSILRRGGVGDPKIVDLATRL